MHLKECMRDPTGFTSLPRRGIDNTEEDTIGLSKLFARITMTSSPTACQWSPSNQAAARGKLERVLTDINADYGNRTLCCRSHGVLLVLVPLASLSLAEQEHGRTIPLAVMSRVESRTAMSP